MTIPSKATPENDEGERRRQTSDALIRRNIVGALGRPPELFRVAVLPLWGNYYRVNVLTGADPASVRIAHSYFVEAADNGVLVSTRPHLAKVY